ncbi:hypothetical protein QMK33_21340 [Hymenobacter sp. H14-R3]|uniref:hypothetical protein n=1 Tax=Hymenobacter sp. H14-R3 TaxID=3046308 RepID=UPI0024BABB14|nr:hypothetical protein [Hymenobacter sp. H14-R3]MDJ0367698.1 hypothetical protein [Hymenobacter sp. H14-R3]
MLGELRQHALATLLGHPLFSQAEQLRANRFAHECEDLARLMRWATSVRAEIVRREADAARQRCHRAIHKVLRHLCAVPFRGPRLHSPRPHPSWVLGAFFPDRADRWAGTFDRLAAARFQQSDSLTFAFLLNRLAR